MRGLTCKVQKEHSHNNLASQEQLGSEDGLATEAENLHTVKETGALFLQKGKHFVNIKEQFTCPLKEQASRNTEQEPSLGEA